MAEFQAAEQFYIEHCCTCGVSFAVTKDFNQRRRNDHDDFYCPLGHGQHYPAKSEVEKAREETQKVKKEAEGLRQCIQHKKDVIKAKEYQVRYFKGEVTKLKKKIKK